jgi:hypothetical protein
MDKEKNQAKDYNIIMENLYIKDTFKREKEVVWAFLRLLLQKGYRFILDNFQMELSMEKENNLTMMVLGMKANGRKEKSTASVN